MGQGLRQQALHVPVGEAVVDLLALPAEVHEPRLAEKPELVAHRRDRDPGEEGEAYTADSIAGRGSFLSIKRINPKNGQLIWEHCQDRAPLDVQFDQNNTRLVFRKEVQVLRFLTL